MIQKNGSRDSYDDKTSPNMNYNKPFSGRRNYANGRRNSNSTNNRKPHSKMIFGFTLLDIDEIENLKDVKFQFTKFTRDENTNRSYQKPKYIVERVPQNSHTKDNDVIDDLADQLKYGLLFPSLEFDCFSTSDKLEESLNAICHEIKSIDSEVPDTSLSKKQMRICIFFGREVFTKIHDFEFDVNRWCKFKRNGDSAIHTTFNHYFFLKITNNIDLIKEKFGLQERTEDFVENKRSIRVIYMNNGKKNKLKLEWNEEKGLWKITRAAIDVRRVSCIDIVSGRAIPDLRLSVKTQHDHGWDASLNDIIQNLQINPKVPNWDGLWFTCKDFANMDCVCVQQTIKKRCFYNDKFQLTIDTTCRDNEGLIKQEDSISVKHLSWRTSDEFDFKSTVYETFKFAKEIINLVN